MNVSSRTPEGSPKRCPVCGEVNFIDCSSSPLDAPCASCGVLLWFTDVVVSVFTFPGANESAETVDSFVQEVTRVIDTSIDPRLLIDLSAVDLLDIEILSVLHDFEKRCRVKDALIVLCTGPRFTQDFFTTLLREGHFLVVRSREEALEMFQQPQRDHEERSAPETDLLALLYQELVERYDEAASNLWKKCHFGLLSNLMKHFQRLPETKKADKIAFETFASFLKAAQMRRFPDFTDRDDLWRLLFAIFNLKTMDFRSDEDRSKLSGETAILSPHNWNRGLPDIPPDLFEQKGARLLYETFKDHLILLDPELRTYAVAKLEGHTNQEIAENFNVSLRTVERKLYLIRRIWTENRDAEPE